MFTNLRYWRHTGLENKRFQYEPDFRRKKILLLARYDLRHLNYIVHFDRFYTSMPYAINA